jgi:transcription termination/antitermination protein NusA
MPEITLDTETLGYIRLFEERTGARVKDCLAAEDKLVFLVMPGEVHKAVGPGGVLVDRLKGMLKKEIQVVEWSDEPETLAKNIFYWYSPKRVDLVPKGKGRHATVSVDPAWKARAIGKAGKNLKVARAILVRHTDIVSVSVA